MQREWRAEVGQWPEYPDIATRPKQCRPFMDRARIWLDLDKLPFDRDAATVSLGNQQFP